MENKKLSIFLLNCRSINNKLGEIKLMLYTRKPDIFCFTETWISRFEQKFIDYVSIWKQRGGPGGGLGIILRKGLQHDNFQLTPFQNGKLEVQAVKIILKNNYYVIVVNIYNPNESVTIQEMKHYLHQLGRKYVLVGDFNAHMPLLDSCCRNSNFTGKTLETIILEERICLINPVDFYTYICPTTGRRSCLATPNIATDIDIKLGTDVGSDHCTVEIEICLEPVITDTVGIKRFKKSGSSAEFVQLTRNIIRNKFVLDMPNALNVMVDSLTDRIYNVSYDLWE